MDNRTVLVFEVQLRSDKGSSSESQWERIAVGRGTFQAWGIDYTVEEYGVGAYSTAIVEMVDGSVKNVPAELIVFEQ